MIVKGSDGKYRGVFEHYAQDPQARYTLPFIGKTFQSLDQYADSQKMYADYMRNVGREIKYPSIRDWRNTYAAGVGNAFTSDIKMAGRTVRSLI